MVFSIVSLLAPVMTKTLRHRNYNLELQFWKNFTFYLLLEEEYFMTGNAKPIQILYIMNTNAINMGVNMPVQTPPAVK